MILIGSGALFWHHSQQNLDFHLPKNSKDTDPVTESQKVALLVYKAMIGSEFEKRHRWHEILCL